MNLYEIIEIKRYVVGQAFCGHVFDDPGEIENNFIPETVNQVWWDKPEPAINTYYYGTAISKV